MKDSETFEEIKAIIKELSVGEDAKKSIDKTFDKTQQGEDVTEEEIQQVKEATKKSRYVRKISELSIDYSEKLLDRTRQGFHIVLIMYVIGFGVGIALIALAMGLAISGKDTDGLVTVFFGSAGVIDIGFLLYKPAEKIQQSRGVASRLLAPFMEWQFVSIWSGKLFGKLYEDFESCTNKDQAFEKMVELLKLKVTLTEKLVVSMKDATSDIKTDDKPKIQESTAKLLENDKKNLSKATGAAEDKLDYTGWKIIKQEKEFSLGEDKGEGLEKLFWASKHEDTELKKELTDEEIKEQCEKTPEPDKPKKQCSEDSKVVKKWKQWSLFKHEKEDKWKLRCYNNIQWRCIKIPSQVANKK